MQPSNAPANKDQIAIAAWLIICCIVIFGMIVLGGVTRLTGSGLSMVEWEPVLGILPPLNQAEWQETFLLYQQYPEYKLKNLMGDRFELDFRRAFRPPGGGRQGGDRGPGGGNRRPQGGDRPARPRA